MDEERIDIKGLDKAEVLAALHNGTSCLGMGWLHNVGTIDVATARADIEENGSLRFDYYHGRPLKVDISGDSFAPWLYDRDAGPGAAARAIDGIRRK